MAEGVLYAYKRRYKVLPSRPSQLIAFSKIQTNLPVVKYKDAKALLDIAKSTKQYRPKPPPPPRNSNIKHKRRITEPLKSNNNFLKNRIKNKHKKNLSTSGYIKTDYSKMSKVYNQNQLNIYFNNNNNNNSNDDIKNDAAEIEAQKKKSRLRRRAVDELVATEKTYLNRLEKLIKYFVNPLKNQNNKKLRKLITISDHSIIFPSDLNTIYALHIQLQSDLLKASSNWNNDTSKIGHIFIEYGELFKLYHDYMCKHEKAIQKLMKLNTTNSKFSKWAMEQSNRVSGLTIQALLILPIQRLPRYEMLLREIIKYTPQYHDDLYDLQNAFDQICEVTELINDRMKEHDRRIKVAMVEKRFIDIVSSIGHFVKASRIFVSESSEDPKNDNYIIRHDKFGNKIPITIFLFNDCLIYGYYQQNVNQSNNNNQPIKNKKLRFGSILVFDNLFNIEDVPFDDNYNYKKISCLKIYAKHHSIWISFQSYQAKLKWFEMISFQNNCMNSNNLMQRRSLSKTKTKNGNKKQSVPKFELYLPIPVFVPDDYSNICMECESRFNVITRRHHCYFCGKLCCKKCTKYKLIDIWKLYFENKKEFVRVCEMCKIEREEYLNTKQNQNQLNYYTNSRNIPRTHNHNHNHSTTTVIHPNDLNDVVNELNIENINNNNNDNDDDIKSPAASSSSYNSVGSPMSSTSPTTFGITMHHATHSRRHSKRRSKMGQNLIKQNSVEIK